MLCSTAGRYWSFCGHASKYLVMSASAPCAANTGTSALSMAAMSGKCPVAAACTSLVWKSAKPTLVRLILTDWRAASYIPSANPARPVLRYTSPSNDCT